MITYGTSTFILKSIIMLLVRRITWMIQSLVLAMSAAKVRHLRYQLATMMTD